MDKMEKLRIFISWSGDRSLKVAEALRDWLPNVFQFVDPWLSAADVNKGAKWRQAISGQLEKASFGIICLTPENLSAPWILFEAGALSKKADASVCTYLFDLANTQVRDPLAQFQHTQANQEDTRKLVTTINTALGENALEPNRLMAAFERWWPDLHNQLAAVPPANEPSVPVRGPEEKIDEILTLMREQSQAVTSIAMRVSPYLFDMPPEPGAVNKLIDPYHNYLDTPVASDPGPPPPPPKQPRR